MLSGAALVFLSALASDPDLVSEGRVEVLGESAPFTLEPGFFEVVPDAALAALVFDAAEDDELLVELVRLGPPGKGRARATLVVGGALRFLVVAAPTLESRSVGGAFASLPVPQRAPLPTARSKIELRVDTPMGVRLSLAKRQAETVIALVPLTGAPVAPADVPAAPVVVAVLVEPSYPAAPAFVEPLVTTEPVTTAFTADASAARVSADASAARVSADASAARVSADASAARVSADASAARVSADASATRLPAPGAPAAARGAPKRNTPRDDAAASDASDRSARRFPRLLAEVHAGSSIAFSGLQDFVPGGGARVLIGPRDLDAALGFAVDFDGQGTFVDAARWDVASTRLRMDGHLGLGDLAMFDARLGVTLGVGARFAQHSARLTGLRRTVLVIGVTSRAAPEASVPAGPGRFVVMVPLDVTFDMPARVHGFTPVAAGVFLGYRLDL